MKRIFSFILAVLMLLQCGCAVAPTKEVIAGEILSSDDVVLSNATNKSANTNIVNIDKAYVRGGTWADKNWNKINEERIAQGLITTDVLVDDCLDQLTKIICDRVVLDYAWNHNERIDKVYDIYRAYNWKDIVNKIKEIERKNQLWEKE